MTDSRLMALRSLQLPHRASSEALCLEALARAAEDSGVSNEDIAAWISLQVSDWEESGTPSPQLSELLRSIASAAVVDEPAETRALLARVFTKYFSLHALLRKEHGLSFASATSVLSHSSMALYLAVEGRLSAAQIARVLGPKDARAKFSRQVMVHVMDAAGATPELKLEIVRNLYSLDEGIELSAFGDASIKACVEKIGEVAQNFGLEEDLKDALLVLSPTENEAGLSSNWTPYLQILHYQCCIAEVFDHAMVDLYEFKPRGQAANWLFEQYPHSIAGASNPFLNNAKSVEVIDEGWVRAKKSADKPGARAIFHVLSSLDALGFAARRELAQWIRSWLVRIIRIAAEMPVQIPPYLTPAQIQSLLSSVGAGNSGTFGILEQRIVDAVASLRHPNSRTRGIGDSVNATNVSRAKFGDCEFIDARRREIRAYESHGGALTDVYMQQHLLSLKKAVARRRQELSDVAEVHTWSVEIFFVAHDIQHVAPVHAVIDELSILITPVTFESLFEDVDMAREVDLLDAFRKHVVVPMSKMRTPNVAREQLLALAGPVP